MLPASRLFAFAFSDACGRRWQPIIYLLMLCQKVSSIYHNLTFSDPLRVSQGPKRDSAPQATAYQAPKVKTQRSMKSPFSSWHTPQEIYPHFLYVVICKVYDFTSDSLTTECQKAPSVRLFHWGNAYREAAPHSPSHSSSIIAFQACIGKSLELCYVWREQNALEISWNPRLCPNWDHSGMTNHYSLLFNRNRAFLVFIKVSA